MKYIFNYFHSKPEYQRYIVYNDQGIPVDLKTEYINNDRPVPRIPFIVFQNLFGHIATDITLSKQTNEVHVEELRAQIEQFRYDYGDDEDVGKCPMKLPIQ